MKGKGCLIAVLVIIALAVIVALVLYLNRGKIIEMAMDKMVEQVMANLPPDYEKDMARQNIDEFIVAFKEGRVDKEETQEIGKIFQVIMADKKLETQEVDQLMEAMREAAK
jgi:hypothetical protein